jgi:hypothetical protein
LNRVSYSSSFLVEIRSLSCSTARSCQQDTACHRHSTQDREPSPSGNKVGGSPIGNGPAAMMRQAYATPRVSPF